MSRHPSAFQKALLLKHHCDGILLLASVLCGAEVLERGQMHTVQLSKHMLGGRESWLRWHKRFAEVLSPKLELACPPLRCP